MHASEKRIDIMTDIETLGHKTDSTIFQIAAVAFDIQTGEHLSTFSQIADITKNDQMRVTGSTIKWWLNTNKELLTDLINKGEHSSDVLVTNFHEWLTHLNGDLHLWGNGILFDNKMIQHQMELLSLEYPIRYKNDRDMRTIVDLACSKLQISERELKAQFNDASLTHHDAFDDVRFQINLVSWCYNLLIR